MWRKLASQSLVIFGARLTGASGAFLTQALMARLWGAGALGDYLFVIAAVNVTATVVPLGFQVVGGYFAAEYRAYSSGRMLRAYLAQAYRQAAPVILALVAISLLAWPAASETMRRLWPPGTLMAVATAAVYLNGALLVGMKRPLAGLIADTLFRPMLALLGFAIAMALTDGAARLVTMLWIAGAGYAAVAAVQTVAVLRTLRTIPAGPPPNGDTRRRWWRYALPWALIALAGEFFFDIDLILLSHWLGREDLAVFGVCARICALLGFGVGTVYTVTMPDIFEAGARRDTVEFSRRIGDANLIAAGLAAVLALAMFATGPLLALLFGARFASGSLPLGLLALGLLVRAALGPASLVLSFHERPYASLPAAGLGLLTLAAGNGVLVPAFGLTGAAMAALAATTVWSVALWATARHHVKIDVSVLPRLKAIRAGRAGSPIVSSIAPHD
jgi:O-antigen/teichoic acid export membrane protein